MIHGNHLLTIGYVDFLLATTWHYLNECLYR